MEKKEEVPQRVGDYKIKEKIAGGGQGTALLGKHLIRRGNCVVKQFKDPAVGKNEIEVLRMLTSLHHDNIVKCFNLLPGSSKGKEITTIEMEFCSGGTLQDEIESCKQNKEKIPEIQILSWLIQLANGLEAIHGQNIIHQDIKPKNILITNGGVLRIADFGASRILNPLDECSNDIEGTLLYLSPEALIHRIVTKMSDIWSLGVVAYQLCCLRYPYYAQSIKSLAYQFQRKWTFFSPIPKDYSADLVKIIKSMLQIEQSNRPTASKLKRTLQLVKAKNLYFLIKKYKKFGFDRKSLINLVNSMPSPYSLRFFLNPDMQDEKFFDRIHSCRRMHNNEEKITELFFCKSGELVEMFPEKNKWAIKYITPIGISFNCKYDKIIYGDENILKEFESSNFNILDWYYQLLYYQNNFLPLTQIK